MNERAGVGRTRAFAFEVTSEESLDQTDQTGTLESRVDADCVVMPHVACLHPRACSQVVGRCDMA